MKTIILPGYSPHNKDWAYEVKKKLDLGHEIVVHEWKHWSPTQRVSDPEGQGGSFSMKYEVDEILRLVSLAQDDKKQKLDNKLNIIAKSVGTKVVMHLTPLLHQQIQKVILCGIPTRGKSQQAHNVYSKGLSFLESKQVIVFQNTKDPFASYADIKEFIGSINSKIEVTEMSRSDHNYSYFKEFQSFLSG